MRALELGLATLLPASLLFLGACNGGILDGGSSPAAVTTAITDGASDQIDSFTVKLTGLSLHKIGGVDVGLLSAPLQVDLASLSDLSQIINVLDVPAGVYDKATITLDFTGATCLLKGLSAPATILASDGTPLTGTVSLPMTFGGASFQALGGHNRRLDFDFDLDQSMIADIPGNSVTVEPTFVLRVDETTPKELTVLGTLTSVTTLTSKFLADVKAFDGTTIGAVTFDTNGTTVFQIDGVGTTGAAGLTALFAKPAGTWLQVYGAIDVSKSHIKASYVEAGSGTWNGGTDIIEGHVVGRSGAAGAAATLTVLGNSTNATHTTFQYHTSFTVTTSFAATKVVHRGLAAAYDTDDIDVGQRVRIFGTLTGTAMDATAVTDVIRLQRTRVFGHALAAPAGGTLSITLDRVDLLNAGDFTWSESGTAQPDPANFHINSGALTAGLGITTGTAVDARGFFNAIDDSVQAFGAVSVANLANAPSIMLIRDKAAGFTVSTSIFATEFQFVITGSAGSGEIAVVDHGLAGSVPLPTSPVPTIAPASGQAFFTLRDKTTGAFSMYLVFSQYSQALSSILASGAHLDQIGAIGTYSASTNTLTAKSVAAIVH